MRPPRPAAAAPAGLSPGRRLRGPRPERRGAHVAALRGGARGWPRSGGSAEGRPGSAGPGDGARGDQLPVETPAVAPEQRARAEPTLVGPRAPRAPRATRAGSRSTAAACGSRAFQGRRRRGGRGERPQPRPPPAARGSRAAAPTLLGTGRPPRPRRARSLTFQPFGTKDPLHPAPGRQVGRPRCPRENHGLKTGRSPARASPVGRCRGLNARLALPLILTGRHLSGPQTRGGPANFDRPY